MPRVVKVEDVEAFAFKSGWYWVDGENEIVALPCPCTPLFQRQGRIALVNLGLWNRLAYWGPSAETMDLSLDADVQVS